jgi:hypothetical protein
MSEPKQLWSVTAGLYAIAAALLILAGALGNSLGAPRRYQFASSSMAGGQAVWRGDMLTGHVALCATDNLRSEWSANNAPKGAVTGC